MQEVTKVRDVLMIQDLLQRLKESSVRNDFINSRNGACKVSKEEMDFIEQFAQQVIPVRPQFSNEQSFLNSAKASADHFSFLIDGRNRQFLETGLTYEKARDLFTRIQNCGYWEKDVKHVMEESRADNDTPNTDDLESKDDKSETGEKALPLSAPVPTQVSNPSFNGNMMQAQHQQPPLSQAPMARAPQQHSGPNNMQTTVTAVENAYFNQMKYSQQQQHQQQQQQQQQQAPLMSNGMPVPHAQSEIVGVNFSFLQESELDSPAGPGSQQQKMPINVIQTINQPKQSPVQHQVMQQVQPGQTFKNANFHPQSIAAGQMYPPGLKVQHTAPHIPVNYQPSPQQLNQQATVPSSQVPPNMIPKQQQPINGNQAPGFGATSQTPPIQQQQQQRPAGAYPMVPKAQYQQQVNSAQNLSAKPMEQKVNASPKIDGSGEKSNEGGRKEKEKQRDDYQQQPQIDTWTNETATQSGGNNNSSSRTSGGFNRNNRSSGGAKFNNNYR
jgi:Caprin-1 dimerization domain